MRRPFLPLYLGILGVIGLAAINGIAVAATGHADDHVVNGLPPIERCVNDDFNDGSQDRCWTESPVGVIIIDSSDTIVSVSQDDLLDPPPTN